MKVLSLFSNLISPAVDLAFKWKSESNKMELSRQEFELMKKQLVADIEIRVAAEARKPKSELRAFVLDYEGKASEQSESLRNLRSSVRPVITYWAAIIITSIMFGWVDTVNLQDNMDAIPDKMWYIFLTIFVFWFGERTVTRIKEVWKKGGNDKEQAKVKHEKAQNKRIIAPVRKEEEFREEE